MEKQSDYWHISGTDLENLCESVYKITSNMDHFVTVKQEYNKLRKFSAVPAIEQILTHAEFLYKEKNLKDEVIHFKNDSTMSYKHLSLEQLHEMVMENIYYFD
jgi:hypothetical protein